MSKTFSCFSYTVCLALASFYLASCQTKTIDTHGGIRMKVEFVGQQSDNTIFDKTIALMQGRLKNFGLSNSVLDISEDQKITIEIPGETDTSFFKSLILKKGKFGMAETYLWDECIQLTNQFLYAIDTFSENYSGKDVPVVTDFFDEATNFGDLPIFGAAAEKDTATILRFFGLHNIKRLLPSEMTLKWGHGNNTKLFLLYALKPTALSRKISDGGIKNVKATKSQQSGLPQIDMDINEAEAWAQFTKENILNFVALYVDDLVLMAPIVQTEIPNGQAVIMGNMDEKEVQGLSAILKQGPYPLEPKIRSIELLKKE